MRCDNLKISDSVEIVEGKYESKIDIPVLLIFFNRPSKIAEVFEQVKMARPSKLYLYQDGARKGRADDTEAVELCRNAVVDIDWNCIVHRLYQAENFGCDPSEFIAQKWMFAEEEMGIVLEDDDVPSQSFFPYCKELLEKYANDDRVAIICGMNNYDIEKTADSSYFFSKRGSIWGWASWRRFIDLWDAQYSWLDSTEKKEVIKKYCDYALDYETYQSPAIKHRASEREHYESIMFAAAALSNMLNIVPKYNMITNIGVDKECTHMVSDVRLLVRRTRKLLYKKRFEISFPLTHPTEVKQNVTFEKRYYYHMYQRIYDSIEFLLRRIIYTGHIKKK